MADYEERVLTLGRNMDAILLVVSTEHTSRRTTKSKRSA